MKQPLIEEEEIILSDVLTIVKEDGEDSWERQKKSVRTIKTLFYFLLGLIGIIGSIIWFNMISIKYYQNVLDPFQASNQVTVLIILKSLWLYTCIRLIKNIHK